MQLVVLDSRRYPHAMRVFRDLMSIDGPLDAREREFLVAMQLAHGGGADLEALDGFPPITPAEVAAAITDRDERTWTVQFAVVAAMVDGTITPAKYAALKALDVALGVNEHIIKVLDHVAHGRERLARMTMAARLFPRVWKSAYRQGGLKYLLQSFGSFTNGYDDPEVAWRFRQLGLLPEGTVGRALWRHYVEFKRLFPGEKGSKITERMIFHDFGHILSGYETDTAGEIRQGAFQAGFIRNDGFALLMFTLLQWHMGLRLTPVTPETRGFFEPADVLHALQRGASCKVDLQSDEWSHWDVVDLRIEDFRAQYGIPPLVPGALRAPHASKEAQAR